LWCLDPPPTKNSDIKVKGADAKRKREGLNNTVDCVVAKDKSNGPSLFLFRQHSVPLTQPTFEKREINANEGVDLNVRVHCNPFFLASATAPRFTQVLLSAIIFKIGINEHLDPEAFVLVAGCNRSGFAIGHCMAEELIGSP